MRRDTHAYRCDRWNSIDLPLIGLLTAGWITRMVDHDFPLGKGFYALGTPLLFSRVLHFAQIHPFQGPMIQVRGKITLHRLANGPGKIFFLSLTFCTRDLHPKEGYSTFLQYSDMLGAFPAFCH